MESLNQLVEEIISESGIKKEKDKENLRKELYSHFWDESRELALRGYNEEKTIATLQNKFGNIATISRELTLVYSMNKIMFVEVGIILLIIVLLVVILFVGLPFTVILPY
jgi:hypothetical protein